jgi:hypothetical protein
MGILDQVAKASDAGGDFLKALLWGPNGSGKSTLCGTAPGKVLYAYTERQGLLSFKRMAPDADVIEVKSVATLRGLLGELRQQGHGYDSVCLDSFTEMQNLLIDEMGARKSTGPDEPVKLSIEERMFIHDKSKSIARSFRDLPMNVILTCLSETVVVGDGDGARTVTQIMLSGKKLPAQLGQFFNLVGFTYKAGNKNGDTKHRVLFDGRADLDTKGMPGLRRREDPDIAYWYDRAIDGGDPRDPDAPMIGDVDRGGPVEEKADG